MKATESLPQRCLSGGRACWRQLSKALPQIFSICLFMAGTVLLFSAATPAEPTRLKWLYHMIPLSVMEVSHLVASVSGLGLLFLSLAIRRRVDSAYYLTIACLLVAIPASLLKGWEWEVAIPLLILLVLFLPTHQFFYRKSRVLSISLSPSWLILSGTILAVAIWLGFYSYQHTAYSNELWFKFSLHDSPSRFLRTLGTLGLIGFFFLLYRLLTRPYSGITLPDDEEIARALPLIQNASDSAAYLALMQDKHLFWSPSGNSFIMFGTTPQYWISMGDPIGREKEFEDLILAFQAEADRHGARIAFYEVGSRNLPLYLDTGMSLLKIGEQALVNLQTFTLEGAAASKLRQSYNRGQRDNLTFEVIQDVTAPLLTQLKPISDAWLHTKNAREKSFSLGRFDPTYLARGPIAILKQNDTIIAFANLLTPTNRNELSLDLMRYLPGSPAGIMEYLTIHIILWGQAQGYAWFSLGMAPLAGLRKHRHSSTWQQFGNLLFRFGNEFYNFKGLYQYKSKFQPEWKSRYLACPGNLRATAVLLAVSSLIAQGFKGIFTR